MKTDTLAHHISFIKKDFLRVVILTVVPLSLLLIKIYPPSFLGINLQLIFLQLLLGLAVGLCVFICGFFVQLFFWGKPDYLPNFKATIIFSVYTFFINAFVEELFFRGLVLSLLFKFTNNSILAILLSSLVFALYHVPVFKWQLWQSSLAFFLGLVLGTLYVQTNSLIIVWFAHGFADLASVSETIGGYILWGIIKRKKLNLII